MEENKPITPEPTPTPKKGPVLTLPVAVLLGAVIIAIAIFAVKMPKAAPADGYDKDELVSAILATKNEAKITPVTDDDHIVGSATAPITIVEYSDFECPFCKNFHATMQQLLSNYSSDVRWVYRHFPLDCVDNADASCTPLHPSARMYALASECAAAQGGDEAFFKFADDIFAPTSTQKFTAAELGTLAKSEGLNVTEFNSCLTNKTYADRISAQATAGAAAGARGTPFSVIIDAKGDTYKIEGAYPYDVVEAFIQEIK